MNQLKIKEKINDLYEDGDFISNYIDELSATIDACDANFNLLNAMLDDDPDDFDIGLATAVQQLKVEALNDLYQIYKDQ